MLNLLIITLCVFVSSVPTIPIAQAEAIPASWLKKVGIVVSDHDPRAGLGDRGTRGNCTGTLVASNLVLTAYHCITGSSNRQADQLYFGIRSGRDFHWFKGSLYSYGSSHSLPQDDWALIQLDESAAIARGAVPTSHWSADALNEKSVMILGFYPDHTRGRANSLMIRSCALSKFEEGTDLLTGKCGGTRPGMSGGPVLMRNPGNRTWSVVGILFGTAEFIDDEGRTTVQPILIPSSHFSYRIR